MLKLYYDREIRQNNFALVISRTNYLIISPVLKNLFPPRRKIKWSLIGIGLTLIAAYLKKGFGNDLPVMKLLRHVI